MLKRIAITGPESTGKSWLVNKLALHYSANLVEEYAREYFRGKEYSYTVDDLIIIAKKQLENEEAKALVSKDYLFCDTDQIVMKIWSKVVFNYVPQWIEIQAKEHNYDLYLLCFPDIEWIPDLLRTNPDNRQYLFNLYVNELEQNNFNCKIVKGIGEERIKNAIRFVDELK